MYCAKNIASYVINWFNDNEIRITNLKLQKVLFFLQGDFYYLTGKRLIDDDFCAYSLGPVIESVYFRYLPFASLPLPKESNCIDYLNENEKTIIDLILSKYALKTTWELVDLSQKFDSWKYTYRIFGDKTLIPYKSIKNDFRNNSFGSIDDRIVNFLQSNLI